MVEFINISKQFKYKGAEIKALECINFKIEENEMVAITGASGSGKSTILNIAGGILKQSSGDYLFNNKHVVGDEYAMAKFRNSHIGFILQHFALIKNRNVFYNIQLPLKYKNIEKKEMRQQVFSVAESLGISDKLAAYPSMLSGGECQRVAIARAIISKPKIILADEPTSSLDDKNKYEVLDILKKLNNDGATIILATHDETVAKICNKRICI